MIKDRLAKAQDFLGVPASGQEERNAHHNELDAKGECLLLQLGYRLDQREQNAQISFTALVLIL